MKMEQTSFSSDDVLNILNSFDMNLKTEIMLKTDTNVDAFVRVNDYEIAIDYRNEVLPNNIYSIEKLLYKYEYAMIVANYITPQAKSLLKERGINYLDKAQNIYLKLPNLTIQIEGNKNPTLAPQYRTRAFSKIGAAVVFQFLINPKLVNATQRQIADYAGVSLGTIPKVFEGLLKDGFLIKISQKEWQLVDYQKLLQKWVEVLNDKLLPAYFVQRYTIFKGTANDLLNDDKIQGETQWGGEPAAALLTKYLLPETFSLFTENKTALVTQCKLVPKSDGEIFVYHKFWKHSDYTNNCVHPILVYAQLLASTDSRNRETAEIIFNEHIKANI